jgi:hypothetical protein
MKIAPFLAPALLLFPSFPLHADSLTDLFPPDSKVVIGIRVHNLALSVTQTLIPKMRAAAAGWLKAVPLDNIDLLHDIDEVLLASSGAPAGKGSNSSGIVVVAGRFDVARLAEGAKTYRDVPLLECDGDAGSLVGLLDAGTAVIGDPVLVRAAIDQHLDKRVGKGRIDSVLNDRITSLRQRYDFWGLGDRPDGFALPLFDVSLMESIDRFQFGMQLASGLELTAEIHPRSAKDAEKVNIVLEGMETLVKGLDGSFDLRSESGAMKLTVSMPEADLRKASGPKTAAPATAPVPASVPVTEVPETGPTAAAEIAPAPAAPPVPAAAPAPAAPPVIAPKPAAPAEKTDTVILTLPGKK